jgi:hypothetical protein
LADAEMMIQWSVLERLGKACNGRLGKAMCGH